LARYLVTGAAGFLGANILLGLVADGVEVIACDRDIPPRPLVRTLSAAGGSVHWMPLDVRNPADWSALPRGKYRAVVHAAATTPGHDIPDLVETADINLMGPLRALEWACSQEVERFVFISSSAVYRDVNHDAPLHENLVLQPSHGFPMLKLAAENMVRMYRHHRGLDTCSVRLPALFGPWERPTASRQNMSFIHCLLRAAILGTPLVVGGTDALQEWTYAPDAARGIIHLAHVRGEAHVYNLSAGRLVPASEILEILDMLIPDHAVKTIGFGAGDHALDLRPEAVAQVQPMDTTRLAASGYAAYAKLSDALKAYVSWLRRHEITHA